MNENFRELHRQQIRNRMMPLELLASGLRVKILIEEKRICVHFEPSPPMHKYNSGIYESRKKPLHDRMKEKKTTSK